MKILLSLVSFLITSSRAEQEWISFKERHGKIYKSINEESNRTQIFVDNLKKLEEHNVRYEAGLTPYKMKISRFFDKHPDELRAVLNGLNLSLLTVGRNDLGFRFLPSWVELPKSVDWRKEGAVTPVKDQGDSCGGCWAFSATGALEAQHFRLTSNLVSLSEQQLIDCSSEYGNHGCDGGIMENAFQYIKDNGGLATRDSYPYQEEVGHCRSKKVEPLKGTKIKSYVDLPDGDERALLEAVATVGPVSASVYATNPGFLWYGEGIFDGDTCNSTDTKVDHAVLIVGYGTENGTDYWIIKNSWGKGWGEKGYMRMARGKGNICGITEGSSYPLLTKQPL